VAFFGDLGKALGLGSTSDVARFAANAAASVASGGTVPIVTSPFEQAEPQAMNYNIYEPSSARQTFVQPQMQSASSGSFFGNLGQSLGSLGTNIGGFFQDISPLTSLFGGGQSLQRTNSGTAITLNTGRPQETSTSGEILGANLGMGSQLIQAATRFARSPSGQTALGFGAGAIGASLSGGGNGAPRITRRMKSDVRRIYMMAGMDPNVTAQILNNMGTYPRMNFDASLVFFILTKRFRNDGPVVTKAAVRKTKTTLRRMKGVVDMYNNVCKPSIRRAPARRGAPRAVQLIKN
jgi:hypothetical protein